MINYHYCTKEQIEEYFNSPALSQSKLKKLLGGPRAFTEEDEKKLYYEEKGHFIIGSGVDVMLTRKDDFKNEFYISNIEKKPSDSIMSVVQMVFDNVALQYPEEYINHKLENFSDIIIESVNKHNYIQNYGKEKKLEKIIKEGSEYYEELKKSYGKQIISINEKILIDKVVDAILLNPTISSFLYPENNDLSKDIEQDVYFQMPVYFNFYGIECKALIDWVYIITPKNSPVVLNFIDIKTLGDEVINFAYAANRFRYDIQLAWYLRALVSHVKNEKYLPGFIGFIVESTTNIGNPCIIQADDSFLNKGLRGTKEIKYENRVLYKKIKGIYGLLDEYLYYQSHGWDCEKVIKENNHVLKLGINGIEGKDCF